MSKPTTVHVGLDTRKDSIAVAHAREHSREAPVYMGPIGSPEVDVDKPVRRLQSTGDRLVFAYEVGPTGYGLCRYLTGKRYECHVAAPALIMAPAPPR